MTVPASEIPVYALERREDNEKGEIISKSNVLGNLDLVICFSSYRCHGSAGTAGKHGAVCGTTTQHFLVQLKGPESHDAIGVHRRKAEQL